jgi:uncharacterized membrane protein
MRSLNDVKTLGGIGSLLMLLAVVPTAGFVLGIVGAVLVLVAVKYASDVLGDPKIFNNMLYAVILGIVGLVVAGVAVATFVLRAIGLGFMSSSFASTPPSSMAMGDIVGLLGTILLGLVAVWICFLVSSIFLRRSYTELGKRLNVGLFSTAALLYLIGAALTIILVGFIIIFIAEILFLVAFFSIDTQMPPPMQPAQPAQPTM